MILAQVLLPPVKGVADNGDFGKLLGRYGLSSGVAYRYIGATFHYKPEYEFTSYFTSSELVLVAPAVWIGKLIWRDGTFDLRMMGLVNGALYLAAIYLFLRSCRHWIVAGLGVLLFTDFLYVGYLNSFFMDTAAVIFTGLAANFYVRRLLSKRPADTAGMLVSMIGAVLSKPQYAPMGVVFAVLFWAAWRVLARSRWVAIAGSAALLVSAIVCLDYFGAPTYRNKGVFTVFYAHIMTHTPDPDTTLAEFGLEKGYRRWIGHNAYTAGTITDDPAFYVPFLRQVSYPTIGRYYLRHPAIGWSQLKEAMDESGAFHAPGGNFDGGSGAPPIAQYKGFQWASHAKRKLFYQHGGRFFGAFVCLTVLLLGLAAALRRKLPPGGVEGAFALAALAWTNLGVAIFADVLEPLRHQLVFLELFDMMMVACAALLIEAASLRRPPAKDFAGESPRPR